MLLPLDELPVVLLLWMLVEVLELELVPLLRVEVPLFMVPGRKLLLLFLLPPTPLFKFDALPFSIRVSETT